MAEPMSQGTQSIPYPNDRTEEKRDVPQPTSTAMSIPELLEGEMFVRRGPPTYSNRPPPGLGNGHKIRRNGPPAYTDSPPPSISNGDKIKRDSTSLKPTADSIPELSEGVEFTRRGPPTYSNRPPPGLGNGHKVKRDSSPIYTNIPPPGLGSGDKIKRDSTLPEPAAGPISDLLDDVDVARRGPPTYSNRPPPGLGNGHKVRQETAPILDSPVFAPVLEGGNKIKREAPAAALTATATLKPAHGDRVHLDGPEHGSLVHQTPSPSPDNVKRSLQVRQETDSQSSSATATTNVQTTSSSSQFPYVQLAGTASTAYSWHFPQATVAAGNYDMLCPSGDCWTDCQNMTRVFQAYPDGLDKPNYGEAHSNGNLPDLTLFGVCSNLGVVSELAQSTYANTSFASYFPPEDTQTALYNVSSDLSICLADTCQYTRDPFQCHNECSLPALQSNTTTLAIATGVYPCLFRLCDLTCGLPFADQDVYGVGVIASYITQAVLILVLAALLVLLASWRYFRNGNEHDSKFVIPRKMRDSVELFLATECYFGISASIASFILRPATIDPLNGYALLSVSITGFLPPTFTLTLLHLHGVKSKFATLLTFTTWLMSSVLFFTLIHNLSQATSTDSRAIERSLNSLFNVSSCGGSSAMSLCRQAFDIDPLAFLSSFYIDRNLPGIKTIPILWVFSTMMLFFLISVQTLDHIRTGNLTLTGKTWSITSESGGQEGPCTDRLNKKRSAAVALGTLYVVFILYILALVYQSKMVMLYTAMDVIDWDGWSFGQIVALLFWAPPLITCFRAYILERDAEKQDTAAVSEYDKTACSVYSITNEKCGTPARTDEQPSMASPSFETMSQPMMFSQSEIVWENRTSPNLSSSSPSLSPSQQTPQAPADMTFSRDLPPSGNGDSSATITNSRRDRFIERIEQGSNTESRSGEGTAAEIIC